VRALVTGVAGFLGSTLAEALRGSGFDVVGVDAFTPNYGTAIKRANLNRLLGDPGFRLVEADLRDADLGPLLDGVSHVAHLAALPGVRQSWGESFRDYAEHNVIATQRLLEASRGRALVKVAVASSSSVYGGARRAPTPEEEPLRPISPYGVTKLACEHLIGAYIRDFDLRCTALRYFTVYGPRQRPDMAYHLFTEALLDRRPITVFGDGEQTRSNTYIDDAVNGTILALERGAQGGTYNIGGGRTISLNDAIALIAGHVGVEPLIERKPARPGDQRHTSADVSRAREALGYAPVVEPGEGLGRQVAWHLARRAMAVPPGR
jgi:nucleoside-diphosphate-sugar epimerase